MTYFSGTVERVIFENPSNHFKILLLEIEESDSDFGDVAIVVTGIMGEVSEKERYTFWGELTTHPKYGDQLQMTRYEREKPTKSGLISYFSSSQFKGIGKAIASKIVALYGENPIDHILENPERLASISGLSKVNRERFIATLKRNYGTEKILTQLAEYGLSNKIALAIFDSYKEDSLTVVKDTPYRLVEDIHQLGFKTADKLAEQLGIRTDSPERFRAGLLHTLRHTCLDSGDTYVEAKDLLTLTLELLEDSQPIELNPEDVAKELGELVSEDRIKSSDTKLFEPSLYHAEEGIKKHIIRLLEAPFEHCEQAEINDQIKQVEDKLTITYDRVQKEAIAKALSQKIFILTGGPGTGKTTIINGIIQAYANLHHIDLSNDSLPILLAAPTGRAARRMNELTQLPSATIHRHLGLTSDDNDYQNLSDYLDADLIIVDEFSMVDTWLANQLLSAISSQTQLIIVGDSDQLPSVGPGQVLADLLDIPSIPHVRLEKIFRQSDQSTIVSLASQLKLGKLPEDFTQKKPDRSYFEAQAQHIPNMIETIVTSALKSGIAASSIQVLAPMYKGLAGINQLNHILQNLLNPEQQGVSFSHNDITFRAGDKVLHLINDASANVFNGDIGYITDLIPAKYSDSKQDELLLDFDGISLTYPRKDWNKITLAYAMSIHKSQGSEFPVVILPITRQNLRMLKRNLLYTAITRSKSKLVMLGEWSAFDYAVKHTGTSRKTYLKERFLANESYQQVVDNSVDKVDNPAMSEENYRLTKDNWQTIDPMIGIDESVLKNFFNHS